MQTRLLSHTDLQVSRICLGTMTFGAQCGEADARRMVDTCLDRGVNFVDTANIYNQGAAEEMLGRVLGTRRPGVVLASKVAMKMGDAEDQHGLSRAAIFRALDESLRRLRTDYLDIYYLHQPDYQTPLAETLGAMADLVRAGKIRHAAASNYASWQICSMRCVASKAGYAPIHIAQPMYNLLARGIEQEFLPMAKSLEVSTVAYNPLAGGLLTGKHKGEEPLAGTRFDLVEAYRSRYWHQVNLRAVEKLVALACTEGRSLVSLSLNWVFHHTAADCLVLGASHAGQLEENLCALEDGPLSPTAVAVCDQVWSEVRGVAPQYNR
jgi:aryl-alcohol dehydrogenase-like predicted oxidoreductase